MTNLSDLAARVEGRLSSGERQLLDEIWQAPKQLMILDADFDRWSVLEDLFLSGCISQTLSGGVRLVGLTQVGVAARARSTRVSGEK